MKWGNQALARLKLNTDDIPSYEMRERLLNPNCWPNARYTLTHNEGTPSVAIDFSYLKYIVVQPTQKPFTILVIYLICWKNARADYFCGFFYHPCGLLANTSPGLQPAKLRFALAAKKTGIAKFATPSSSQWTFFYSLLIRVLRTNLLPDCSAQINLAGSQKRTC